MTSRIIASFRLWAELFMEIDEIISGKFGSEPLNILSYRPIVPCCGVGISGTCPQIIVDCNNMTTMIHQKISL